MRRLISGMVVVVLMPRAAAACPVCFGANDGPILQGSNMGILALLVVTLAVLGGFARFFFTLARRASHAAPDATRPFDVAQQPEGQAR